jgi:hypothetical protein
MFAQGESLIRGFTTDTILWKDRKLPQNGVALIQRWGMDVRMTVSGGCAAFQAIAKHARSDRRMTRAEQDRKIAPRYSTDNRRLSHSWRFYGVISPAIRKEW